MSSALPAGRPCLCRVARLWQVEHDRRPVGSVSTVTGAQQALGADAPRTARPAPRPGARASRPQRGEARWPLLRPPRCGVATAARFAASAVLLPRRGAGFQGIVVTADADLWPVILRSRRDLLSGSAGKRVFVVRGACGLVPGAAPQALTPSLCVRSAVPHQRQLPPDLEHAADVAV